MIAKEVVAEHLPVVQRFVRTVEQSSDAGKRTVELQKIKPLITFMSAFYETFMRSAIDVRVRGFSYRDKRQVSRRLIREEDRATRERPDQRRRSTLELAALFEDLCDLLHGELEFGYSSDDEDYEQFHRDAFPKWLASVGRWLGDAGDAGDPELAESVRLAAAEYARVVRSAT